jgi:hypothetical protein
MASLSRLCTFLLIVVVALLLIEYCGCKSSSSGIENLEGLEGSVPLGSSVGGEATDNLQQYFSVPEGTTDPGSNTVFTVKPPTGTQEQDAIQQFGKQMAEDIGKTTFQVKDFLPQEINTEWFQTDLSSASESLDAAALVDISKFCQGVDTVGQSLKNPSYDIRGNIPNPKMVVSPFLNSSYDPDTNIKSWC